jgi:hypothetical protein
VREGGIQNREIEREGIWNRDSFIYKASVFKFF